MRHIMNYIKSLFMYYTAYDSDVDKPGHLVFPLWDGLRIPAKGLMKDLRMGMIPVIDMKSGDELLWIMNKRKSHGYRWVSILSEGGFHTINEVRAFWKSYENHCNKEN